MNGPKLSTSSNQTCIADAAPAPTTAALSRKNSSTMNRSHSARRSSFDPKWWMTRAGLTSAAFAMARTLVRSNPFVPKSCSAAFRMRARVVRSSRCERTFKILNGHSTKWQQTGVTILIS